MLPVHQLYQSGQRIDPRVVQHVEGIYVEDYMINLAAHELVELRFQRNHRVNGKAAVEDKHALRSVEGRRHGQALPVIVAKDLGSRSRVQVPWVRSTQ